VSFLRRFLRGAPSSDDDAPTADGAGSAPTSDAATDAADEARDLDVLRAEQARLDDLAQRQLRYARYAWAPPTQGGERRSGDEPDASEGRQGS
jgi:hypothetical protein